VSKGVLFPERAAAVSIDRYAPSADLRPFVRHYWIPRWALPEGETHEELLLQYATCNLVIGDDYAAVFGLARGVGSRTLAGEGWAFGVMLQPGTARALIRPEASIESLSQSPEPLDAIDGGGDPAGAQGATGAHQLVTRIRSLRRDDTGMVAAFEQWLRALGLDPEAGRLINAVVDAVESDPSIRSVDELARRFALSVRSLQRLTAEFVGMNPKWLLQRQRLQDAAARLRDAPSTGLAALAAELGYADQAHFSRDFAAVVGLAPGEYSRRTQSETR
jgi:AraC-like DNA-binding protein